jgi:hypothetical protein
MPTYAETSPSLSLSCIVAVKLWRCCSVLVNVNCLIGGAKLPFIIRAFKVTKSIAPNRGVKLLLNPPISPLETTPNRRFLRGTPSQISETCSRIKLNQLAFRTMEFRARNKGERGPYVDDALDAGLLHRLAGRRLVDVLVVLPPCQETDFSGTRTQFGHGAC